MFANKNNFFKIIPLSIENIDEAISLVHNVFPEDALMKRNPGSEFRSSLNPERYKDYLKSEDLDYVKFFVALDEKTGEVLGTTGLYHDTSEPEDIAWLGWFCVKPGNRGMGLGKALLQFTIDLAKKQKRKTLKVYVEEDATEALNLYERFGFQTTHTEQIKDWVCIYKELKIE